MENYKLAKLICVSTLNNNKFYNMTQINENEFKVEYGRVGASKVSTETYSMSRWNEKYKGKLNKGKGKESYEDITHLQSEKTIINESDNGLNIKNKKIKLFIEELQSWANASIQQNYKIESKDVTPAMIDKANELINEIIPLLDLNADTIQINKLLLSLYKVIPRKMKNVNDNLFQLLNTTELLEQAKTKIDDERATLQSMASQVKPTTTDNTINKTEVDYLESIGLELVECTADEIKYIKSYMKDYDNSDASYQFKEAFKVVNKNSKNRFDNYLENANDKKTMQLWHGSVNKAWWYILQSDLKIFPSAANGSYYGRGNYFANKMAKSRGYSSLSGSYYSNGNERIGYLAILDVAVGNQRIYKEHQSECSSMNYDKLQKTKHDSVYAKGGADLKNDEFITYQECQSTLKYIIKIGK